LKDEQFATKSPANGNGDDDRPIANGKIYSERDPIEKFFNIGLADDSGVELVDPSGRKKSVKFNIKPKWEGKYNVGKVEPMTE